MDTFNNMASAAAKAVWGDKPTNSEPVSGKTGNTADGEPYDAGNIEEPRSKVNDTTTTLEDNNNNNNNNNDHAGLDKTKDSEDPSASEHVVENHKSTPSNDNPEDEEVKLDGPGPRPLEEIAREHGGDAGNSERKGSLVPPKDPNDENAAEEEANSHEDKGDGTKYIRSSGLKADGGDFDATKPGAGREADRLMEEKGMHPVSNDSANRSSNGLQQTESASSDGSQGKNKKRLSQRIKDKLHSH